MLYGNGCFEKRGRGRGRLVGGGGGNSMRDYAKGGRVTELCSHMERKRSAEGQTHGTAAWSYIT